MNAVRSLAIILEPYIPFSTEKIWRQLYPEGYTYDQKWDSASELLIKPNHKLGNIEPLFKKITTKEIEMEKSKLGK